MRVLLTLFLCLASLCSCSSGEEAAPEKPRKNLIILCGITMIDPVRELMGIFEAETGIKAVMSYGGSADLMQSIVVNRKGDIYFPGNMSFIVEADEKGVLAEHRQVGVNQAALFVRKGNPRGLTGDVAELARPDIQVAIGHPDLGSIGKETRRILDAAGIYDRVVASAAMMAADSKALTGVLLEGKVDVVLNWKPVLHIDDNAARLDILPILGGLAQEHPLAMAVTACSQEPEAARQFLDLCASARGRAVFERYGF